MSGNTSEKELRERVDNFLLSNFPQIKMHGGEFEVAEADPEDGFVSIRLSAACSGCGLSPMTTEAIRNRLPDDVEDVQMVKVETGSGDISQARF